jgi:hypothetical protein
MIQLTWQVQEQIERPVKKQFDSEKIQDDIFFKKNIKTIIYWIDPSQLGLTCQIHDMCHETMITIYKINQNKL